MFAYNEKLSLTVMNVRDKSGKLLPINIPLPLNNGLINLPENISQISIIEYHEGVEIYGHCAFNIYVGQTGTFEEIMAKKTKIRMLNNLHTEIKSCKEHLVYYQKEADMLYIFASVQGNDIVVENIEELTKVIKTISKEFLTIKKSVSKIRKLSYKSNSK